MSNYNQSLIEDYRQTIERLQKECTEKTDLNIKLMARVKELEEKLKIAEEALKKISKLNLVMEHNGYTYRGFEEFLGKKEAQQALQKMEEVK